MIILKFLTLIKIFLEMVLIQKYNSVITHYFASMGYALFTFQLNLKDLYIVVIFTEVIHKTLLGIYNLI